MSSLIILILVKLENHKDLLWFSVQRLAKKTIINYNYNEKDQKISMHK